jgi:hypothetical protein
MSWIKRNLYFLIGSLVALGLIGLAGWYLYSKWELNNTLLIQLDEEYAKLKRLYDQKPHPGNDKINNIQEAKEQQKQLRAYIQKACQHFQNIPPIPVPESGKVTSQEFSTALSRTIDQLAHRASEERVALPPPSPNGQTYSFSFEVERPKLAFAAGSLEPLSVQLGEVKAICDVLLQANISALDGLRRERVSEDEQNGQQTDFLPDKSVTNELAVLTPYEMNFRCFSKDLAAVLAGFANSPYGLVVKSINVEPALAGAAPGDQSTPPPATIPVPTYQPPSPAPAQPQAERARASFEARYGGGGPRRGLPPPVAAPAVTPPTYQTVAAAPKNRGGLPTVLNEKQLKITLSLVVVKLVCPK